MESIKPTRSIDLLMAKVIKINSHTRNMVLMNIFNISTHRPGINILMRIKPERVEMKMR